MSVQTINLPNSSAARTGLLLVGGVLVAVAGFSAPLLSLVDQWVHREEYSHGFLIPIVSLWLLWSRRDALRANIGRPSWTGPALTALAVAMLAVGQAAAIFNISQYGFVLALIGLVIGLGGYSLLRPTFVPILFLLFAIPAPRFLEATLSLKLQLISSQLGAFVIALFQIPVFLDGNIIDLGGYKIQVVEACSGLRYIWPFMSLSFLAAYLFNAPFWQRAVVFLSSIPLTIAMNGFRIGLLGVMVHFWSGEAVDGAPHLFEGWVIFLVCTIMLALEVHILARVSGRTVFTAFDALRGTAESAQRYATASLPLAVCVILLAGSVFVAFWLSGRAEFIPDRPRFVSFPERIGQWQGRASLLDPGVEHLLNLDDYILSDYSKPDGHAVNLYVGYYGSQRKTDKPHSPSDCIPSTGWQISKFDQTSIEDDGVIVPVNRVLIEKNSIKQLVYYWFDESGRKVANEYLAKWYFHLDALLLNQTDGSLVRFVTRIPEGETERDADLRLRAFIHDALPTLSRFLPSRPQPPVIATVFKSEGARADRQ